MPGNVIKRRVINIDLFSTPRYGNYNQIWGFEQQVFDALMCGNSPEETILRCLYCTQARTNGNGDAKTWHQRQKSTRGINIVVKWPNLTFHIPQSVWNIEIVLTFFASIFIFLFFCLLQSAREEKWSYFYSDSPRWLTWSLQLQSALSSPTATNGAHRTGLVGDRIGTAPSPPASTLQQGWELINK